jgi:hypothetical protein
MDKLSTEDLKNLELSPGGAGAEYEFLERGNSPLLCHGRTTGETKEAQARDAANDASAGNHSYADALSLGKNDPRAPPKTYEAVQKMASTYAAKNFVLWGNSSNFYIELMDIVNTMKMKSVLMKSEFFKGHLCRQIVWAIYDDMAQYFSTRLEPDHFARATPQAPVNFPQSRLAALLPSFTNGQGPYRINFPYQWKTDPNKGHPAPAPAPAPRHTPAPPQQQYQQPYQQQGGNGDWGRGRGNGHQQWNGGNQNQPGNAG